MLIINIDVDSDLFGNTYVFEIDRNHAVMVPSGYANGLITLEENTVIQYFVDNPYSAESERSILYSSVADFQNVVDSLTDKVVISEKDAKTTEAITSELENWSDRKKTLFTNPKFIEIAIKNLELHLD
jgi:dTDP-4-dehydrorhamnose 3,5-epimerase-like enzyme